MTTCTSSPCPNPALYEHQGNYYCYICFLKLDPATAEKVKEWHERDARHDEIDKFTEWLSENPWDQYQQYAYQRGREIDGAGDGR